MGSLGMPEILVIGGVLLLLFGSKLLPQWGKSIGQTIKELKGVRREFREAVDDVKDLEKKL